LLAVTELTTGTNVGVTSVRMGAVPTVTLLTNEAVGAVTLATPVPVVGVTLVTAVPVVRDPLAIAVPVVGVTLVIALVEGVVRLVPVVKKFVAVGAVMLVPLVKNPGVEVTLVTTGCGDVAVPLTTGTVSSWMGVLPGPLASNKMLLLLFPLVAPLAFKANPVPGLGTGPARAGVGGGFVTAFGKLGANAGTKRLVGTPGVGVMPVTVPVVAAVNTVPVA
jgi:hypothetical protein